MNLSWNTSWSREITSNTQSMCRTCKRAGAGTHWKRRAAGGSAKCQHERAGEAGDDGGGALARERPERARQNQGSKQREPRQYRGQPGCQCSQCAQQRARAADGRRYEAGNPQRAGPQHRRHHSTDHCVERLHSRTHFPKSVCQSATLSRCQK